MQFDRRKNRRFTDADLEELLSRGHIKARQSFGAPVESKPDPPRQAKMRNIRIVVDGESFDSKREYARYCQLQMLEKKGIITGLRRQVPFVLAPPVKLSGRTKPALKYTADFVYKENGKTIVEDTKSPPSRDTAYMIRKHLMMWQHGIEIRETF